jgi:DNA mismatch repair protein MutS
MLKQYYEIKSRYPDVVLFYRMGDFYEMFFEDAKLASEVLGLTLTKRGHGVEGDVPLAGFPYHQLESYLARMTKAGHRVAVCEQVEDPKLAKGVVKRAVTEVVSAGTTFSESALDETKNNYLASVYIEGEAAGLAYADATTGEFFTGILPLSELPARLAAIEPSELLCAADQRPAIEAALERLHPAITALPRWHFTPEAATKTLVGHFGVQNLKGFGLGELELAVRVAGALVDYLRASLLDKANVLPDLQVFSAKAELILDASARRHLELVESQSGQPDATLFAVINRTRTSPGARLLRRWLVAPLTQIGEIRVRQSRVAYLVEHSGLNARISEWLTGTGDLQRTLSKLATNRGTPRDAHGLRQVLAKLPEVHRLFAEQPDGPLAPLLIQCEPQPELVDFLNLVMVDDPPLAVGDGKLIRPGFSADLDELRNIRTHANEWILQHQMDERARTGISSLKIGYNRVFGYYIEITHAHKEKIPLTYIRKQTLTNAERYVTPELKTWEEKILNADERISTLELEIWEKVRQEIISRSDTINRVARALAEIDVLHGLAQIAREKRFVCPELSAGTELMISGGRHPVVESLLPAGSGFMANDLEIGAPDFQIMVLTGPNMAGKSTYLRQQALIVILAQIGSFVPAEFAQVGIVDRIFTRIGAGDNLAFGESTFLVEMTEVANILRHATPRSLIILDEVGRGTSTYDGLSLAWSITEYLHDHPSVAAKTLFATHYHELNRMAKEYSRIQNYRVEVEEWGDRIVFLHKISKGETDRSYGVEVARLAGLPGVVVDRARALLPTWEGGSNSVNSVQQTHENGSKFQLTLFENNNQSVIAALLKLDVNTLTARDALVKLFEIKEMLNNQ